jgi:hypothetical protein
MRCLIEKVVTFPGAETVRLTGPTEPDLTVPGQAKFVMCNHTIENKHRFLELTPDVLEKLAPVCFGDLRQVACRALGLS